jgi:hypothetical protein
MPAKNTRRLSKERKPLFLARVADFYGRAVRSVRAESFVSSGLFSEFGKECLLLLPEQTVY